MCCTLLTGVVDVDGDGVAERIVRSGYPEDMPTVALEVSSETVRWTARLPSEWI